MNKQSPECIRVRTEIAKKYCGHNSKIGMILADRILAIKGLAILADDQSLPDIECFKGQVKRILTQSNFKRVVE